MQRTVKNKICRLIIVLAVIAAGAFGISRLNIETVDEHKEINKGGELKATIKISCGTLLDKEIKDKEHFNSDGIILDSTQYGMDKGDTVFDLLKKAVRDNDIQMEYKGGKSIYVEGIDYIYEFDYGELSGWMYKVNGVFPGVGCGNFEVKDGDEVEFLYTCDLGRDVGNEYKE